MQVQFLGQEDPLEEGMVIHSSILAWKIPGAWRAKAHKVAKSRTQLKQLSTFTEVKSAEQRITFAFLPMYLCAQSCRFCDPMDCSPPGSSVQGISQPRTPEWVAISFSREHLSFWSFVGTL